MTDTAFEAIARRDGAVVAVALGVLTLLAWLALLAGAGTGMDPAAMSGWLMPFATAARAEFELDPALLAHRLHHVGGHDGGDDAAIGLSDRTALRACRAARRTPGPRDKRPRLDRGVRVRLSQLCGFFSVR